MIRLRPTTITVGHADVSSLRHSHVQQIPSAKATDTDSTEYINLPSPNSQDSYFTEESNYSCIAYDIFCRSPAGNASSVQYSDDPPQMTLHGSKIGKEDYQPDRFHFRYDHNRSYEEEDKSCNCNIILPSGGVHSIDGEILEIPSCERLSKFEEYPNRDFVCGRHSEPPRLVDDDDDVGTIDFISHKSVFLAQESHNFAEIYTNQAQRSDSTSPAYIAATTVLSPTGYHQLPLHITGDSQPVSSNTSILSPEPTRVSSSRPEQKINLRYDSQESSMAYSRATPHITTKLYYDLLPIDTISESEATEKKRELFAISPSLTPPLNPDLTSIEDHKMLQTQKQGFRRSTNSSSSDSGSSTIIHRLTSPQYITKSHDMSDLSIHGDVAETPSSIVSPRSNISSVITPRRSRDSETPLRICPSPPVRYQIYNDTLPSSIQPQTPDQLPEARHQSRYHPSYTIPNNNRFALSRLLFDNITPRSSSQHSGSPLGRAMDRGGVRMPSPIGLSDEGYRGLFGGRENTGD